MIDIVQQADRTPDFIHVRVRAIIFFFIFPDLADQLQFRKHLADGQADIRIGLIIFQACVVTRMMFLDQIVLQDQRFHFGIRDNVFKIGDLTHHPLDLW